MLILSNSFLFSYLGRYPQQSKAMIEILLLLVYSNSKNFFPSQKLHNKMHKRVFYHCSLYNGEAYCLVSFISLLFSMDCNEMGL